MVLLEDLHQLKRLLASTPDLMAFWTAFYDMVEKYGLEFMNLGGEWRDETTRNKLIAAAGKAMGVEVVNATVLTRWIPEAGMAHGQVILNGTLTALVYFEDIQIGCLSWPKPGGGTAALRVTITKLSQDPTKRM